MHTLNMILKSNSIDSMKPNSIQTSVKGGDGGNSSLGRDFRANANSEALKCKHKKYDT